MGSGKGYGAGKQNNKNGGKQQYEWSEKDHCFYPAQTDDGARSHKNSHQSGSRGGWSNNKRSKSGNETDSQRSVDNVGQGQPKPIPEVTDDGRGLKSLYARLENLIATDKHIGTAIENSGVLSIYAPGNIPGSSTLSVCPRHVLLPSVLSCF